MNLYRRSRVARIPAGAALVAVLLSGCDFLNDPSKDVDELPSLEGKQIRYTPEGCDYTVTTPEVDRALFGATDVWEDWQPEHVHLSWAGPTDSTFAVNWRTGNRTTVSQVLYGTDPEAVETADGQGDGVRMQEGHTLLYASIFDVDPGKEEDVEDVGTRVHEVHVCGLTPSTTYYYKVGGPGAWSRVYRAATGPVPGTAEPFRFAVMGDSRNRTNIWAHVQKSVYDHGVDLQLFSGDAVNLGPVQTQWDNFFQAKHDGVKVYDVLAEIPLMAANGNHDVLALNYLSQFAFPQEVSPGEGAQGMEWYSFDYGNMHVVVLNDTAANANSITQHQVNWLREDLRKVDRQKTPWVFAIHHRPPYSCGATHGSDIGVRSAWQPIYDEFGVDIVFNGHVHNYERSWPIRGFQEGSTAGTVAASGERGVPVIQNGRPSGTIYVVAAGAGAPLYGSGTDCYHTYTGESIENYVVVDIEGRTMNYRAYRLDGSVLDEFTYTK